jgi:hypothetical protein
MKSLRLIPLIICLALPNLFCGSFTSVSVPVSSKDAFRPEEFSTASLSYSSFKNHTLPGGGPPTWCFTGATNGGAPIPPLNVAPDGGLTGECNGSFDNVSFSGTTTGQMDPQTGDVSWVMNMVSKFTRSVASGERITKYTIEIRGSSRFTNNATGDVRAEGQATWTLACQGGTQAEGFIPCSLEQATDVNWSGTLDWVMTLNRR